MPVTVSLTREHSYVLGVLVAKALLTFSFAASVGNARRRAKVPYPYMYVEKAEAEKDAAKHIFNCTQRAHQNTLEYMPIYLIVQTIGSIEHPTIAAALGALYVVGRYVYAQGYSSGKVEARNRGAFGYIGLIGLLALSCKAVASIALSA
ncbi:hypothetical protein BC831DRAFT_462618 [Entophlyctis helioformis]|nr:hypothetical protein BC831DRAFT_462618 [Entophlyctis helioformis]